MNSTTDTTTGTDTPNQHRSWRERLAIHPAAELFPLMGETDPAALRELADDIQENGLREHVKYYQDADGKRWLLDGRNRLDALELLGWEYHGEKCKLFDERIIERRVIHDDGEARAYVISANIRRRHLTNHRQFRRLLRSRDKRPRDRRTANKRDELAPPHVRPQVQETAS